MPINEFWHGEKRLYEAYQKAYYNNLYETAWINGLYINYSINTVAANIFSKKGAPHLGYPKEPIRPFDKNKNISVSSDTLEENFRELNKNQSDFIRQLLNKKRGG